jgi:isoquinoline 1-oxidoreductase beta subunit
VSSAPLCGIAVNPDTIRAQMQSAVMFGLTAALYGEVTLKNGRAEQSNFDSYQMLRMNEAPVVGAHTPRSGSGIAPK